MGDALLCNFGLSHHVETGSAVSDSGLDLISYRVGFMALELILPSDGGAPYPTLESNVYTFASLMLQGFQLLTVEQIYTERLSFWNLFEAQVILKIVPGELPHFLLN
jgi:hypothetical protein